MSYRAPVADIAFTLKHAAGLKNALADGIYGDLDEETVDSVLAEAGRYASDVIAPLNSVGDKFGTPSNTLLLPGAPRLRIAEPRPSDRISLGFLTQFRLGRLMRWR